MTWAMVTGAGKRLGKAIAEALAESGHDLILHVHSSSAGAEAVKAYAENLGRKAHVVKADLTDAAARQHLCDEVMHGPLGGGALDVLVHNAGLFEAIPFADIDAETYRRMQAVNVEAPFFMTQRLLPALSAADTPCVVHITDVAATRPVNGYAHYSVSKAGLDMLTRALAIELAPHIRVNAVAPGTVIFPEDFSTEMRDAILKRIPMAKEGSAADIAKTVCFLVNDAPYVTGQSIAVDGGRGARL